ncbi:hypothetical protein D6C93_09510 [Aureobasidium pullulans]|uniref:Small ribosomal subunit protein mS38 n=1 Tax=Aureobasidium pullulans TaxID=5580 RepID=A0A4S9QC86_AURPU|nr:hypothetical protein D6D24_04954 [Aureobasidium pullulans]THY81498.1 hypothetical protein D6C93_09510 [Aureobasidium pullulans]
MFSSQLGRAARVGTQSASISTCAVANRSSSAACPTLLSRQRRLSSSKASCPPNGDSNRSRQPAAATKPELPSSRPAKSRSGANAKSNSASRNVKAAKDEAFGNLPSVPSTEHILPQDITLSSFFSLHRPLSLDTAIPPAVGMRAFNTIFEPKSKQKANQDVIFTLSNAIDGLESQQKDSDLRWEIIQESSSNSDVKHLDGVPRSRSLEELVAQLKPFTAPPPPAPVNIEQQQRKARAAPAPTVSQKHFKTTITVTENKRSDGVTFYTASATPPEPAAIKDAPSSASRTPFKDRLRSRQLEFMEKELEQHKSDITILEGENAKGDMHAISVKRQRKLKMKKHKYKKLMKRTRNLRRRLDRN